MKRADLQLSRLVVISPVRDEADNFPCTLASVLAQSKKPDRWIIVDDGSRDSTRQMLEDVSKRLDFVTLVTLGDRGRRLAGPGVVRAMEAGLEAVGDYPWDFLAKLDGDVELPPCYYQKILEEFAADDKLGIAAGQCISPHTRTWVVERNAPYHTRGPCKVWRRECFEQIGGLRPVLGWDGLDGYEARMKGWHTRTLDELKVLHLRPTHSWEGRFKGAMRSGRGAYNQHYRPEYFAARVLVHMLRRPYLVGALGMAAGFLSAWLTGHERKLDRLLVEHIRQEQAVRLRRLLTGKGEAVDER